MTSDTMKAKIAEKFAIDLLQLQRKPRLEKMALAHGVVATKSEAKRIRKATLARMIVDKNE